MLKLFQFVQMYRLALEESLTLNSFVRLCQHKQIFTLVKPKLKCQGQIRSLGGYSIHTAFVTKRVSYETIRGCQKFTFSTLE